MTTQGDDDDLPPERPTSNRARQLFGTKAGAKPWDAPSRDAGAAPPPRAVQGQTASAPYPKDASYTPRPEAVAVPAYSEVDDDSALTRLHPNYKLLMRLAAIIGALVVAVAGIVVDYIARTEAGFPFGVIQFPAFAIALFIAIRVPLARYNARGYQMSDDRLRVVRGVLFHSDTIVPFGRVQHIDVDQGPIERALGIATLTLHTAGSHNASVHLPGLGHDLAIQMRETIRAHIKRESM
ncbi:MAG: PH domain-containing protein [Erythrobacter sp.]